MTTKNVSNNTLRENNKSHEKHNRNNNINFKNKKAENNKKENNNNYKRNKIPTYNIKIGERNFCLTSESLNRDAPNFFTAAFFGYFSEAKTTSILIERDPTYFAMIVRYLRGYEVDWPINDKISMNNLLTDVKFYCFGNLQNYLEDIYEKKFPERVIPWKIVTYVPEDHPVVVINIKDVELERWNSRSLVYDTNPISKKRSINEKNDNDNNEEEEEEENDDDGNASDNEDNAANDENNENNENNDANDNDNNDNDNNNENTTDDNDLVEPNADKGLYRLEIHGKDATATVTSNHNNGIKFENFTLKNSAGEETFRALTESFRTSEGSLTLSPSLKLPFLKDSCIEIDGSKYYTYKELSSYFGVTSGDKKLYFEEIVLRIDDGAFLMRARALTIPFYYASQPFQS